MSSQTLNIISPAEFDLEAMLSSGELFERLLNSLYDGVYFVDTQRRIHFWNRGAEFLTGYQKGELLGRYCFDNLLQHTDETGKRLCHDGCPLQKVIESGEPECKRVFLLHKDQRRIAVDVHIAPLRNDAGRIIGGVEVFRDASAFLALEKAYATMSEMAEKDHLTGIANRRQIDKAIDEQLALLNRTGIPFTIIIADLDHFKEINDLLGHEAGDEALILFVRNVQEQCRSTDLFARIGGDEFILLLRQQRLSEAIGKARRLQEIVKNSRSEKIPELEISASFGVTEAGMFDHRQSLIDRADKALYQAKAEGRNRVLSM